MEEEEEEEWEWETEMWLWSHTVETEERSLQRKPKLKASKLTLVVVRAECVELFNGG